MLRRIGMVEYSENVICPASPAFQTLQVFKQLQLFPNVAGKPSVSTV